MTFKDMGTWKEDTITTNGIYKEWKQLRKEEPENHAETFMEEILNIIEATVYEQNDFTIIDRTPKEIKRIIARIRNKVFG